LEKLGSLYEEEAITRQARKLSKIYRESEIRKLLWANHNPWGVRKSINWENTPGWPYPLSLEFAELVE